MSDCCKKLGINSGAGCVPPFTRWKGIILTPTLNNAGVRNSIDASTALDEAIYKALVNNIDRSLSISPVPELDDVNILFAEPRTTASEEGRVAFLNNGIISFSGQGWSASDHTPALYGKLKETPRCVQYSVYGIDRNGKLIGLQDGDDKTKLYPIDIDKGSWNILPTFEGTENAKLTYNFNFKSNFKYEDLAMLDSDAYNLSNLVGLRDVLADYAAGSGTTALLTGSLHTIFGSLQTKGAVEGQAANLEAFNKTTGLVIPTTSIVESSPGVYLATYTGPVVVGNDVQLRMIVSPLNNFDGAKMLDSSIATV